MSDSIEDIEKVISEQQLHTNPLLAMPVEKDSELKEYLVEYVGTKLDTEEVTVNMIAEVMATDFPEFAFAFAEENYLRGYQQGLNDAEGLYSKSPETTS
jgi:hypothetical protein|tara:strand:+ start:3268 stop:3564 length:297 start_codon:yes stop_codon:yes gene_type:complete